MAPEPKLDPKYDDYDYPTTAPTVQSGHPGHTTPEQDAQVHQLRMSLEQMGYKERLDTLSMVRNFKEIVFDIRLTMFSAQISTCPKVQCRAFEKDVSFDELLVESCIDASNPGS